MQLTGYERAQARTALRRPAAAGRAGARALSCRPRVLLLDEPLGALDARLRKNLQVELKALQAELGITFVFVTHDQEEALTMSDRLAIMNGGRVEQAGSPKDVYEEPETRLRGQLPRRLEPDSGGGGGRDGAGCALRVGERLAAGRAGRDRGERRGEGDDPARACRASSRRAARARTGCPASSSMPSSSAAPTSCTFASSAATCSRRPCRTTARRSRFEEGTPVTLHLPADAMRVLAPQE